MKQLTYIALAVLSACGQKVQHGLDEAQANEIETLLTQSGIDARKVREGGRDAKWAIEVPEERTTAAIKLLSDHDLPRKRAAGFAEVFGKGSLVPTAVEENALYLQALSGEISQTLTAVSGVVNARVHLVTSPAGPHSALRAPVKARASVLLKARHGEGKTLEQSREGLQALVAGSVDGLDAASVSILISEIAPPTAPTTESPRRSGTRTALVGGAALIALLSICLALSAVYARRLRMQLASRPPHLAAEDANPPADDDAQSMAEAA